MRGVLIFICIIFFTTTINAQRVTSQSASEAFARGEYEIAYDQYQLLLKSFPKDPLYLYGAGVSLVQSSTRPGEAVTILRAAVESSSAVKKAPADARFYLARALHLSGYYDEAASEYARFASEAGKKESKDFGIAVLIKQCEDQTGKLPDVASVTVAEPDVASAALVATAQTATTNYPVSARVEEVAPPDPLDARTDSLLLMALAKRKMADSLETVTATLELAIRTASGSARDSLRLTIDNTKKASSRLYSESDSLFILAGVPFITKPDAQPNATTSTRPPVAAVPDTEKIPVENIMPDTLADIDNQDIIIQAAVVSLFEIKKLPYYSASNPVTVSPSFPDGLLYTIQLAVFRNPVDPAYFKRLYPVFGIRNPASELTFYYSGLFRNQADASRALQNVKNEGFTDAFTAILMDGKPISAERASVLAKDWGTRGLPEWKGVVPANQPIAEKADSILTLLLRVEVLRAKTSDNKQINDEIARIAGERGFEILNPEKGLYVYLVGKFLTFESASAYADLLRRNGYKESRVVAYAGTREVPMETAMKYFEKLIE